MSSAYLSMVTLLHSETRRLVYMENNSGLITELCGVPVYVVIDFDVILLTTVL